MAANLETKPIHFSISAKMPATITLESPERLLLQHRIS
jgi:hypothetical protein